MPRTRRSFKWPLAAAAIVALAGVFAQDPVIDALTGETVTDAGLTFSLVYLLLAPIGAVYDQLSLVTDRQHVSILASLAVLYAGARVGLGLSGRLPAVGVWRRLLRESGLAAGAFAGLLAVYAYGVLGPRPMTALQAHDSDLVIVDFHSHTEMSHDGRPGLSIADRRAWHAAAGFDLAYVTDHTTLETGHAIVDAVKAALADNPERAGERLSLLPGREVRFEGQHVVVLGALDPTAGIPEGEPWPVVIQTIPNNLTRVPVGGADGRGGVQGIELVDADPRAFRQSAEERDLILALVDSLDLAVIAGSNHHGWGRAAAAWNLVRMPGWQEMAPEEVGRRTEAVILRDRVEATRVVERPRLAAALPGEGQARGAWMAVTALPRFGWHILTSLTMPERLAWLGWILLWAAWPLVARPVAASPALGPRRR
jgi:hypothetical protein